MPYARASFADFLDTDIEVLGGEAMYGPHASEAARSTREVMIKIGVKHATRKLW